MGNLSSQYISQSFQSLLHLGSDNTASATLAEIQDALGNGVGVFVSTQGNLKVTNSISASAISASTLFGIGDTVSYSASVSTQLTALENITSSLIAATGSYATTGSNNFVGNQNVSGDLNLTGTLTAYAVKTIFETSSVIYSSGSNQFGDASNDTQTLIGRTNISGSLSVTGSSIAFKGEVSASYISSSRIEGLGGGTVSDFSQSVQQQFNDVLTYENNNDTKWNDLQPVTSSLLISVNGNLNPFTASQESYNTNNNSKWSTLSVFTASIAGTNQFTASIKTYTGSNDTKWTTLGNLTGSYATTGSNTFIGSNTFTGSVNITGSAYGDVNSLVVVSNTASMDMSKSNFYTLTLPTGSTRLVATNVGKGQTVSLKVTQGAITGSLTFSSQFLFPTNLAYSASATASAVDIVSFITFDTTSSIFSTGVNRLV
jgi:hypothetical protein